MKGLRMSDDYYKILEVPEGATAEEIKKSYRRLSLKYHPDKNVGNPDVVELFQKINGAFEVLGDVEKRQEYDGNKNNPFTRSFGGGGGGHGHPGFHDINELFSNLFGQGMMNMHGMGQQGQGSGNNHIFSGFPGHGFPGPNIQVFQNGVRISPPNIIQKPSPITKNIEVTMKTVLDGSTIPVEIERWIIENNLKVFEKQTIYVPIPKGVDDNEIIILTDQGNVLNEQCKGDIKLFVKIVNDTEFTRNGLDLILERTISLKEALCGFSFEMKYINDKSYTIHNQTAQNIIQPGYKKVIPNMGLTRDNFVGNLIISFNIKFPETLTEEQIKNLSINLSTV